MVIIIFLSCVLLVARRLEVCDQVLFLSESRGFGCVGVRVDMSCPIAFCTRFLFVVTQSFVQIVGLSDVLWGPLACGILFTEDVIASFRLERGVVDWIDPVLVSLPRLTWPAACVIITHGV